MRLVFETAIQFGERARQTVKCLRDPGGRVYDFLDTRFYLPWKGGKHFVPPGFSEVRLPLSEKMSFLDWIVSRHTHMLAQGEQPAFADRPPDIRGRHRECWYRINANNEAVVLIERTIPGAIWDYYKGTVDYLQLKPGAAGASDDSGCGDERPAKGRAGIARKRGIDFNAMREKVGQAAAGLWDAAAAARGGLTWDPVDVVNARYGAADFAAAQDEYREQPALIAMQGIGHYRVGRSTDWLSLPREQYIRMARDSALVDEISEVVNVGELMIVPGRHGSMVSPLSLRKEKVRHDGWFLKFNTMLDGLSDATLFMAARVHS
jgi:hypothetical protein